MSKNLKKIATIPYSEVKFRFVSDHWDFHLVGTCIYNNELCEFKSIDTGYNDEKDEFNETIVEIYKLSWRENLRWRIKQWLFEKCVGYHWTYKNGKRIGNFYYRSPKWFYLWLSKVYYKVKKY